MNDNVKENIIAFLIIAAVVAAIWLWAQAEQQEEGEERIQIQIGESPTLGNPDAPVRVVEFSDFECPFCSRFALQEFSAVEEHVDAGNVEFVYKHFPLTQIHSHALLAAQAAACADEQDAFWEYHDVLYRNQDALQADQLLGYADGLGLNTSSFRECLIDEQKKDLVLRDKQQGIDAGVTGTPTFFFNGRKVVGALTAEEFGAEVEKELNPQE